MIGQFDPPTDPTLRQNIEETARRCAQHPAYEEVLRSAASDKHAVLLQGRQFVVNPSSEGYRYFHWCLESLRRQQQPPPPPPPVFQQPMFHSFQQSFAGFAPNASQTPPVFQQQQLQQLQQLPSVQDFRPPIAPPEDQSTYDIPSLVIQYKEPSPPPTNDDDDLLKTSLSSMNYSIHFSMNYIGYIFMKY